MDVFTTAQDGAVWISRTARLQRYNVAKMLQEGRKFSKADGALVDLEMFVLVAVVVMQMNMLETWPKSLNASLNAAIDVGVSSIQSAHHGRMADRVDEPAERRPPVLE